MTGPDPNDPHTARAGMAFAVAAFLWWGLSPIYFKAVGHVAPIEVMAHRIIWSVPILALLLGVRNRWVDLWLALQDRNTRMALAASTCIVTINWFFFIWGIDQERLLEISLGYFINPLVSVLLGFVVLRERLDPWQWLAVLLAAIGVANLAWQTAGLPWLSLLLAGSFATYGLIRKMAKAGPTQGLFVETSLLTPLCLAGIAYLAWRGEGAFIVTGWRTDLLFLAGGLVTCLPLLWWNAGAKRLRLSTIGIFQYIAPSVQFLLAVLAYGEPFTLAHQVTFAFIWAALAVYSARSFQLQRRTAPPA